MSTNVQTSRLSRPATPSPAAYPYVLTGDAALAAHLSRGRTLQARAVRDGLGALARGLGRSLGRLLGDYGTLRERYARPGPQSAYARSGCA